MKTINPAFAHLILTGLLVTLTITVFSQKNNTWKGGAPGLENDWNCPKNWSAYAVPDDFTNVFIPDVSSTSLSQPVIKSGKVEINSLFIASNVVLTIGKDAQLVVLATAEGVNHQRVKLYGSLILPGELNEGKATPALPLASKIK